MDDKTKLNILLNTLHEKHLDIPEDLFIQIKSTYLNDSRSYEEIRKEIGMALQKLEFAESLCNKTISDDVKENSILLIGPMCTGKSYVASSLEQELNMPRISLDSRKQLSNIYEKESSFKNKKEFEFYLTATTLTGIDTPHIIDFGAGHSVYENPLMFFEMNKLMSQFKNVVLLMPSEDIDLSNQILNQRLINRGSNNIERTLLINKHFIDNHCNYDYATKKVYTENKSIKDIKNEIVKTDKKSLVLKKENGYVNIFILTSLVAFMCMGVSLLSYIFISIVGG